MINLHKKYIEWWKIKLNISSYGIIWISFVKGLIIGLLIYLVFLFYLYFQAYRKTDNLETKNFGNLLSATALYLIFSSLIITGLYNLQEETAMILGVFLYLKSNSNKKS